MKKLLIIVLALIMVLSFSACGGGGGSTDDGGSGGSDFITPADEAIVATGSQFTTLDPALNTETVNEYITYHIYSGLFRFDENGEAVPELCDTFTTSDDGLTWTFTLKDGLVWSDGDPLTAKDFEYSYLRVLAYGPDAAYNVYDIASNVVGADEYNQKALEVGADFDITTEDHSGVGIKAIDDKTLEIKLINPIPYFPRMLTSMCWIPVKEGTPVHDSLWSMEPGYACSGPYVLTDFNQNEKCVMTKNENYFDAANVTMPSITFMVMPDADSQAAAFKSGEVDLCLDVSMDGTSGYEGTDSLWVRVPTSAYFLSINSGSTGPEWAHDVNVRKALAMAINKDDVVDILGGAEYYPILNGYIPYGFPDSDGKDFRENADNDGFELKYDPDKAKELLAGAGYDESNPLKIKYKYSNNGIHEDVATAIMSCWKEVGIEVEPIAVEAGVFYDQLDAGDYEISRYGYSVNTSPIKFLELWTRGMQVTAAVDDPAYDDMVTEVKARLTEEEFTKGCHELEDYLVEENAYLIPMFTYADPSLINPGLAGVEYSGNEIYLAHSSKG